MLITPLYAAILALTFFVLSVRTLRTRRELRIGIGDAGHPVMLRTMRVHSNFAEYAPFTLLLILLLEFMGAPNLLVHLLCVCLLVGRVSHAYGVSNPTENYTYLVFGMAMTFTALVGSAVCLLGLYAWRLLL